MTIDETISTAVNGAGIVPHLVERVAHNLRQTADVKDGAVVVGGVPLSQAVQNAVSEIAALPQDIDSAMANPNQYTKLRRNYPEHMEKLRRDSLAKIGFKPR